MVRSILIAGAVTSFVAGTSGLLLAALGTVALERLLPPLAIDTDALRGAIVALAAGVLLVGLLHLGILAGLRAGRRVAWTAGVLLAAVVATTFVALAAASGTSAIADPDRAGAYLAGLAGASIGAAAYGLVAAGLLRELRSGSII
jgi:hypothetical protein